MKLTTQKLYNTFPHLLAFTHCSIPRHVMFRIENTVAAAIARYEAFGKARIDILRQHGAWPNDDPSLSPWTAHSPEANQQAVAALALLLNEEIELPDAHVTKSELDTPNAPPDITLAMKLALDWLIIEG